MVYSLVCNLSRLSSSGYFSFWNPGSETWEERLDHAEEEEEEEEEDFWSISAAVLEGKWQG